VRFGAFGFRAEKKRGFTRSGAGNRVSSDLLIGLLLYRLSGTESTDDQ
jgi:hypothetical protein